MLPSLGVIAVAGEASFPGREGACLGGAVYLGRSASFPGRGDLPGNCGAIY